MNREEMLESLAGPESSLGNLFKAYYGSDDVFLAERRKFAETLLDRFIADGYAFKVQSGDITIYIPLQFGGGSVQYFLSYFSSFGDLYRYIVEDLRNRHFVSMAHYSSGNPVDYNEIYEKAGEVRIKNSWKSFSVSRFRAQATTVTGHFAEVGIVDYPNADAVIEAIAMITRSVGDGGSTPVPTLSFTKNILEKKYYFTIYDQIMNVRYLNDDVNRFNASMASRVANGVLKGYNVEFPLVRVQMNNESLWAFHMKDFDRYSTMLKKIDEIAASVPGQ